MDAAQTLERLQADGMTVQAVEGRVRVSPPQRLTDAHRAAIQAHRAGLLALLIPTPAPRPAVPRSCADCTGFTRLRGLCTRAVDSGLLEQHGTPRPPEGWAASCVSFEGKSGTNRETQP